MTQSPDFDAQLEGMIQAARQDGLDSTEIYDLFGAVSPKQRTTIFLHALQAGILDDDYASEFLTDIRADCGFETREDRAFYADLLAQFREQAPELFRKSSMYYHLDLISIAIADGDTAALPDLMRPYLDGQSIDLFSMVIDQLKYHGLTEPLRDAMETIWPRLPDRHEYAEWASDEFAGELMDVILVEYLNSTNDPQPDNEALLSATKSLLAWKKGWLEWFIRAVVKTAPGPWSLEDFSPDLGHDAWLQEVNTLLVEFMADQRRSGIPLSRGMLAWRGLVPTFSQQFKASTGSRRAKKGAGPRAAGLLVPQARHLDTALGEHMTLMGGRPYLVVAVLELVPAYLDFIEELGLIRKSDKNMGLSKARNLVREVAPALENYYSMDPVALSNLAHAWD